MTLMDLAATLRMDVSQFLTGSRTAKTELSSWRDETGKLKDEHEELSTKGGAAMENVAGKYAAAGLALSALSGVIVGLASEAIQLAGQFQQAEIALTGMMRSGTQAQQFLSELKTFAATSPFEFPDLLDAAKRLQALGFESTAVIPIMRSVGDAVAGLGGNAQTIDRITLALGQMNAKGKVSAQEMNQLAEQGIPAWQAVADAIGKSIPEAMKEAEKGAIAASVAIPAVLESMQARFGGMMEAQMVTLAGRWSNLKDQLSFVLADIGGALTPFANTIMDMATPLLEMIRSVAAGFAAMPQSMQGAIVAIGGIAAAVGPVLLAFAGWEAAIAAIGAVLGLGAGAGLTAIIGALTPVLVPLAAAIAAGAAAWELWQLEPVRNAVGSLLDTLQNFWTGTLQPLVETIAAAGLAFGTFAASVIGSGLEAAWQAMQATGSALWDVILQVKDALSPLGDAFNSVLSALSPLLEPLSQLFDWVSKLAVLIVGGALIAEWNILSAAFSGTVSVISTLASIIATGLVIQIRAMSDVVKSGAEIWSNVFRPAIEFVITKIKEFLGVIAQIPGVKQAIEAVNTTFGTMKEKVGAAVDDARGKIKAFGTETQSSVKLAKDAVDAAQKSYDDIAKKFRDGKTSADELKRATDQLATAKRNFKDELDKTKPKIDAVQNAVRDARKEYDEAEKNLRRTEAALRDNRATADEVVAAQTRLKNASITLKNATGELEKISSDTGVTMKDYSGGLETVRGSLERTANAHGTHAGKVDETDKEYKKLQTSVKSAQDHFELFMSKFNGATWNFERFQDFVQHGGNVKTALNNIDTELEKLRIKFGDKLPPAIGTMMTQLTLAKSRLTEFQDAANALKIEAAFEKLNAELAKIPAKMQPIPPAIAAVSAEVVKAEMEFGKLTISVQNASKPITELPAAIQATTTAATQAALNQGRAWRNLMDDMVEAGKGLQRDVTHALTDLFTGKGWDGFKTAGLNALTAVGDAVTGMVMDSITGLLKKSLKDIVTDTLPSLTSAFKGLGSFLLELFGDIGSAIVGAIKGGIDFITGFSGGAGQAVGAASSAAGSVGQAAGSAGAAAGSAAGGVASGVMSGVVGPIAQIATAVTGVIGLIQGMGQSKSLGQIEENTRFTQIALIGQSGVMHWLSTYLPKLEGMERFNYQIIQPSLAAIETEIVDKVGGTRTEVINMKDVLIQAKDILRDIFNPIVDAKDFLSTIATGVTTLSDSLVTLKTSAMNIDTNTAKMNTVTMEGILRDSYNVLSRIPSGLINLDGSLKSGFSTSLTSMASSITGPLTSILNAVNGLDLRGTMNNSMQLLSQSITQAMNSASPVQAINNGFQMISTAINGSYNTISAALQSIPRQQAPANNTIVNINGVQQGGNLSNLLRQQGLI